jgi:hypothetical protein
MSPDPEAWRSSPMSQCKQRRHCVLEINTGTSVCYVSKVRQPFTAPLTKLWSAGEPFSSTSLLHSFQISLDCILARLQILHLSGTWWLSFTFAYSRAEKDLPISHNAMGLLTVKEIFSYNLMSNISVSPDHLLVLQSCAFLHYPISL